MTKLSWGKPEAGRWKKTIRGECEGIQIEVTQNIWRDDNRGPEDQSTFKVQLSENSDGRSYPTFHPDKEAAQIHLMSELEAIIRNRQRAIQR